MNDNEIAIHQKQYATSKVILKEKLLALSTYQMHSKRSLNKRECHIQFEMLKKKKPDQIDPN